MDKKIDYKKKLEELFKGKKATRIILVIGIAGIILIFLSTIIPKNDSSELEEEITSKTITSDEYAEKLEERLTSLVEKMDGVGSAEVMVTLENGIEYVYANTQKETNDSTSNSSGSTGKKSLEEDVIIIQGENGQQAIVVTEIQPTVKGVVVVCDGGENISVKNNLVNAISTALNISSNRVSVIKSTAD